MKDFNSEVTRSVAGAPVLKVVHKKSGKLDVFFPFSEVPIEMTPQYFKTHVKKEDFRVNFTTDRDHPIAG